jgi:hypothetical protein
MDFKNLDSNSNTNTTIYVIINRIMIPIAHDCANFKTTTPLSITSKKGACPNGASGLIFFHSSTKISTLVKMLLESFIN